MTAISGADEVSEGTDVSVQSIKIMFSGLGGPHLVLAYPDPPNGHTVIDNMPNIRATRRGLRRAVKLAQFMEFSPIIYKGREVKVKDYPNE